MTELEELVPTCKSSGVGDLLCFTTYAYDP